jgi:uncharacterized protein YcbX
MQTIGRIREIWRYPVKSMGGEKLSACGLGPKGIPGDRAWALRDEAAGEIRGGKKFPALLRCTARSLADAKPGESPPAEIAFPDGMRMRSDSPEVSAILSALVGRTVTLHPLRPADDRDHYRRGLPDNPDMFEELRSIFGREKDEPLPDLSVFSQEMFEFTSPLGTYFDAFPLHFVTTATLEEMQRLAPDSNFDPRRFRPNFVVESAGDATNGLVESKWSGRELRIGAVRLRVEMPTVRCSMVTQAQQELPKDPAVLRTVVRSGEQNLGAYATVLEAGEVKVGDEVALA